MAPFSALRKDFGPAGESLKNLGYNVGDKVFAQINKKSVALPYAKTFMDVAVGDPLLYVDSRGRVGIAVNQDNYSRKFNITPPGKIFIPRKSAFLQRR